MELNPGLSEVVFGLRAEVEALKTRLTRLSVARRSRFLRPIGKRLSGSVIREKRSGVSCSDLVEKNGTLSQESQGSTRRSHDSAKIRMQIGSQV